MFEGLENSEDRVALAFAHGLPELLSQQQQDQPTPGRHSSGQSVLDIGCPKRNITSSALEHNNIDNVLLIHTFHYHLDPGAAFIFSASYQRQQYLILHSLLSVFLELCFKNWTSTFEDETCARRFSLRQLQKAETPTRVEIC